jgi:putative pyruvate formate lyase activating enzyme
VSAAVLARMMVQLQNMGCHNVNLVTPSHVVAQILEALPVAIDMGLRVPLVYNTGGYDRVETLRMLEGVVDIYMPDIKFLDNVVAARMCSAPDYPDVVRAAVREMHRQVGDLQIDEHGLAQRGLLVRHLVLPHSLAGTEQIVGFLANKISQDTYLNLMDQYHPAFNARQYPKLNRVPTSREYQQAVDQALAAGLRRLDQQKQQY